MARGDGIHRTSARNARMKDADIGISSVHAEKKWQRATMTADAVLS